MAVLLIQVASVYLPDPYTSIGIGGTCSVEGQGPSTPLNWGGYVGILSQVDLNAAVVTMASAVATAHSLTFSTSMIVGWPTDDDSAFATATAMTAAIATAGFGYSAVPGASSTVSLTSGTARQPSATRPVLATVTGAWSWNITVLSTVTGSLTFKSDAAATPTTTLYAPAWSRGITVGVTVADTGTMPVMWSYVVPPSHFYSVTAAGGATFSIREQVL